MHKRLLLSLTSLSVLAACSNTPKVGGYPVISELEAQGQNSRVRHIVLHYTATDTPTSLELLTQKNVSSHYLISDDTPPKLYQLVPEDRRAWHAGISQWYSHTDLNTSSIGIEIVNKGFDEEGNWYPYQPEQLQLAQALVQELIERHEVPARNVVGHSDIAPQRKSDPGPLFPWQQWAQEGVGRWYDEQAALQYQYELQAEGLPEEADIQQLLLQAGYTVPLHGSWDEASKNVMKAFQMHYRPARFDGQPDAESIAILKALQP